MQSNSFDQPNQHFVSTLIGKDGQRKFVAAENIYDANGDLLLARDKEISTSLSERLLDRRLKKPLELSMSAVDGVTAAQFAEEADAVLESTPAISALAGADARRLRHRIASLHLTGPLQLMLSVFRSAAERNMRHTTLVTVTAQTIGQRVGLSEDDLRSLAYAGLAHDLGELYIDPALLEPNRDFDIQEWKHLVVHPRVGSMVVARLGELPTAVSTAIDQHHERLDGTGYPSALRAEKISRLGEILMTAEALAGILSGADNPEARAALALQFVPGQFAADIVRLLARGLRAEVLDWPAQFDVNALGTRARQLLSNLTQTAATAIEIEQDVAAALEEQVEAARVRNLCNVFTTSLHATGVIELFASDKLEDQIDPRVATELDVVVKELGWRLRALARHIELSVLQSGQPQPRMMSLVAHLSHRL